MTNLALSGVLPIIAAGNDGQGSGNKIFTPGDNKYALTVGALDDNNAITSYSSEGGVSSDYTKPDVTAPGGASSQGAILQVDSNDQDVEGAFPDFVANDMTPMQGTSMATPHVSGATSLVIDAMGGYSGYWNSWGTKTKPMKLKQLMMMTTWESVSNSQGSKDVIEGAGRINPGAAIEAATMSYTIGSSATGTFGSSNTGTKVWARSVSLTAGSSYTFDLTVPSGQNFDLFLYDPDPDTYGQPVLASSSTSTTTGANEQITFTPSTSGTYYIVVKTVSNSGGSWTLTSSSGAPPSNELQNGVPVTGSLDSTHTQDDYTIVVDANAQSMRIVLDSGASDYDVYQRFGQPVGGCSSNECTTYDNRGYTSGGEDITINSPAQGTHYITVIRWSGSGSYTLTVTVTYQQADTTPPTVSITSPTNGATVSGTVTISFTASDTNGISSQAIKIDGTTVSTSSSFSWDTTTASNGVHTITVEATDPSGNTGTDSISVTVSNSAPSSNIILSWDGYDWDFDYEMEVKVDGQVLNWAANGVSGNNAWKSFSFDITSMVSNPDNIVVSFKDLKTSWNNDIKNVKITIDGSIVFSAQSSQIEPDKTELTYVYTNAAGTSSFSGQVWSSTTYDDQYFYFRVGASGTMSITVSWTGTADLDIEVWSGSVSGTTADSPTGTRLATGFSTTNPETVSLSVSAGIYLIRVNHYSGADPQGFSMSVAHP